MADEHLRHALRQAFGVTDMGGAMVADEAWRRQEPRGIDVADLDAIAGRHYSLGRGEGMDIAFRDAHQRHEVEKNRAVASALDAIGATLIEDLVTAAEQATAAKQSTRKSILEAVQERSRRDRQALAELVERVRKGEL
jgi:hypothetical protein